MAFDFEKMKQFGFSDDIVAKMKQRVAEKESEKGLDIYQWKFLKYVGKTVNLKLTNGEIVHGKVDSVSSPGDNDNDEESVFVETPIGVLEFFENEVASVEE